jgi:excisionase family DNA binding protein
MKWRPTFGMPASRFNKVHSEMSGMQAATERAKAVARQKSQMDHAMERAKALARQPDPLNAAIMARAFVDCALVTKAQIVALSGDGTIRAGDAAPFDFASAFSGGWTPTRAAINEPPIEQDSFERVGEDLRSVTRRLERLTRRTPASAADEWLSVGDVAKLLGVSKSAIAKQAKRRGLEFPVGGRIHIRRADIDKLYPPMSKMSSPKSELAARTPAVDRSS